MSWYILSCGALAGNADTSLAHPTFLRTSNISGMFPNLTFVSPQVCAEQKATAGIIHVRVPQCESDSTE